MFGFFWPGNLGKTVLLLIRSIGEDGREEGEGWLRKVEWGYLKPPTSTDFLGGEGEVSKLMSAPSVQKQGKRSNGAA